MPESNGFIAFNIVPDDQRSEFPIKHFQDPLFDMVVFRIADNLLPNYSGGYWEYVLAEKESGLETAFMRLREDDVFTTIRNPFSGEAFEVDQTLAGMIVTSYAMSYAMETRPQKIEFLGDRHYQLRNMIYDYARTTGKSAEAFGMLD